MGIGGDDGEREMPLCPQNAREEALHERELGASLVGCVLGEISLAEASWSLITSTPDFAVSSSDASRSAEETLQTSPESGS